MRKFKILQVFFKNPFIFLELDILKHFVLNVKYFFTINYYLFNIENLKSTKNIKLKQRKLMLLSVSIVFKI